MDLGRYFLTQHSLRTLTSELTRATMLQCSSSTAGCTLSAANIQAVEAKVPFLVPGNITLNPGPPRTAPDPNTGVMTITASVSYPFTFMLPVFAGLNGAITDTTQVSY